MAQRTNHKATKLYKVSKHKSSIESIAWLDDEGRVKPLDPPPYDKSIEPHEKHIQHIRDRYTLLSLGMKDMRMWMIELENKLNKIMERLELGDADNNSETEYDIETI